MTRDTEGRQGSVIVLRRIAVCSVLAVVAVGILVLWQRRDTLGRRSAVALQIGQLEALAKSGSATDQKQAIAELTAYMEGDYSFGANRAVRALGRLGPLATPAVPEMAKRLASTEFAVSRGAALALADLGPNAEDAVPSLMQVVSYGDARDDTTWFSAMALGKIGPAAVPSLPALRSRVGSGESRFEYQLERAIKSLEKIESDQSRH